MKKVMISPSLLAADKSHLKEEILKIEETGCEYLHFDVMDGIFVPNTSFSSQTLHDISSLHHMVNDVHIMIVDPLIHAEEYLKAGADVLTFHVEACHSKEEVYQVVNLIHSYGKKAGLSIKPNTDVHSILDYVKDLDLLLVMSVEPGFGGQSFLESSVDKIKVLRQYIDDNQLNCLIEVDGGINQVTGKKCRDAGVDILVAGTYIFHSDNYLEKVESLRQ